MAGKETVQFYISKDGSAVERPEKELKAFKKVLIKAGKVSAVALNINVADLAYFDDKTGKWIVEPGKYKLMAGSSSRDIRQVADFTVAN